MLKLGAVPLGEKPAVALALPDGADLSAVKAAMQAGAHLVELRVDQFSSRDTDYVVREFQRFSGIPLLGTIRAHREGGHWQDTEERRLALYRALLPWVDAIDIELSSHAIRDLLIAEAHAQERLVIGSFHDFGATPDWPALQAVAEDGHGCGVDIVKVACYCQTREDLQRLARFTLAHADNHVIVIGMGSQAALSRIFFPALGSLVTYTFLGEPTAPGQLNCDQTLQYLSTFY